MALSKDRALRIARHICDYNEEDLEFIRKLLQHSPFTSIKEWAESEANLKESEELLEKLGDLSWEKHQDKIDNLISLAEAERDELLDDVDRFHKKFGIDRS
jgi:hypothetical protein